MPAPDRAPDIRSPETVRLALVGWRQRVQAVIEIARDSDDLAVRVPVVDELARGLVIDLERAMAALDAVTASASTTPPPSTDVLREALGKAHAHLAGIELWHRPTSVGALRKARDQFAVAVDSFDP